jgi:hypothetical protein
MKVVVIVSVLTEALGRSAFGGHAVERAAGIKGGPGIVYKDIVQ